MIRVGILSFLFESKDVHVAVSSLGMIYPRLQCLNDGRVIPTAPHPRTLLSDSQRARQIK